MRKVLLLFAIGLIAIPGIFIKDIVEGQVVSGPVSYEEQEEGEAIDAEEEDRSTISGVSTTYSENNTKLQFQVPEGLIVDGFENMNPSGVVINWQKIINLTPGESIVISVWNRETNAEIKSIYTDVLQRDGCNNYIATEYCIINFPLKNGEHATYSKYFLYNKKLIRVIYTFTHLYKVPEFKKIANSLLINGVKVFLKRDYKLLNENVQIDDRISARADTCGGFSDPGNPMDCCNSNWDPQGDFNNANCTWYALYKRPDLRGKVYGNAGNWYNAAQLSGLQVSSSPTAGAIVVWSGHVAHIESVSGSNMTWSEQNCYTYWMSNGNKNYGVAPYNASVTRATNSTYGGTLYGFIPFQNTGSSCDGINPVLSNFSSNGPLTCRPSGSLTIKPESRLNPSSGDINILL